MSIGNLTAVNPSNAHVYAGNFYIPVMTTMIGATLFGGVGGIINQKLIPFTGAFGGILGLAIGLALQM